MHFICVKISFTSRSTILSMQGLCQIFTMKAINWWSYIRMRCTHPLCLVSKSLYVNSTEVISNLVWRLDQTHLATISILIRKGPGPANWQNSLRELQSLVLLYNTLWLQGCPFRMKYPPSWNVVTRVSHTYSVPKNTAVPIVYYHPAGLSLRF